jgi:hypothetical protein
MSLSKPFASCLAMLLLAGGASAGDQVPLRISLTLVDACHIQADDRIEARPVRVECSGDQPFRVETLPSAGLSGSPSTGPDAAAARVDPAPGTPARRVVMF